MANTILTATAVTRDLAEGVLDRAAATDLGLRRTVAALTGGGPPPADLGDLAEGWRPWQRAQ